MSSMADMFRTVSPSFTIVVVKAKVLSVVVAITTAGLTVVVMETASPLHRKSVVEPTATLPDFPELVLCPPGWAHASAQ